MTTGSLGPEGSQGVVGRHRLGRGMWLAIHKGLKKRTSVHQEALMVIKYQAYDDAHTDSYECPGCGRKEDSTNSTESASGLGLFCAACKKYL